MAYRWIAFLCMLGAAHPAAAIDIPMSRNLAVDALDSKTCYGTIKSDGQLVGYELNDLLVASSGNLLVLKATGAFVIGKRAPRRYVGHGIEVTISPRTVMSDEKEEEDFSVVLEEGFAVIQERGQRKRIPVKVIELCSP